MNRHLFAWAALAWLAACGSAAAMERAEYRAQRERIQADYEALEARCKPLRGNERDLCQVRAQGTRMIARAQLDAVAKPGPRSSEKVQLARADAAYAYERERCDELRGNDRDVCRKDAKAALATARASAKAATAAARDGADPDESMKRRNAARREQADALYAAGKERCDALDGQARDLCMSDLKKRMGRL